MTNNPEVVAYHHINKEDPEHRGVSLHHDASCTSTRVTTEPLVRLSDYEILQADLDRMHAECLLLEQALAESLANDRQAMNYLNQVREIVGGDDFPDMVERVAHITQKQS